MCALQVIRLEDPHAFREATQAYLMQDEVRHNLILGLTATLIDQPEIYPEFQLWTVEEGGVVVGAGLRTPPYHLTMSEPATDGVVEALVEHLKTANEPVSGIVAGQPAADEFAARYGEAFGVGVKGRMDQAIHALTAVEDVPVPSGAARKSTPDELELLLDWFRAFHAEAADQGGFSEESVRKSLHRRLLAEGGDPLRLWCDPEPVCLTGYRMVTDGAARVGPVYTPPEARRRGYATALVAGLTRELMDRGLRYCLLYTDLANPTSNAIYHRIGYRVVCDSAMIAFDG